MSQSRDEGDTALLNLSPTDADIDDDSTDNVDVQHSRMSQPRDDGDTALLNLSPTDADIDDDSTGNPNKKICDVNKTTVALVACVCLLIAATILLISKWKHPQVCQSPDCISISATMLSKMNTTVNPCDDFYQYACGAGINDPLMPPGTMVWGSLARVQLRDDTLINRLLDKSNNKINGVHSTALQNAKSYFVACMKVTAEEKLGNKPLLELIKSVGSWTVTNDPVSGPFTSSTWSLEAALAKAGRYDISVLFSMGVVTDSKDNTVNRIGFDQGGLTLPFAPYKEKIRHLFIEDFAAVCKLLGGGDDTAAVAEQVWKFERDLSEAFEKLEDGTNARKKYHRMSLAALQRNMPDIDLSAYMKETFGHAIHITEEVLVLAPSYLTKMNNIVKVTPKETLANYIVWHLVKKFQNVLPKRDDLTDFKFNSPKYDVVGNMPRWRSCVDRVNTAMKFAVGALFVDEHFSSDDKKKAGDILKHVHQTFSANFARMEWMDDETKARAREKAVAISQMIGYPDFAVNPSKLDEYYADLTFLETDTFENEVRSFRFYRQTNLEKLYKTPDRTAWKMGPATVNAYYSPQDNSIVFPAGILQKPLYDPTFPMAVNFGAIGSVMGHELTHAFDNKGRLFDKFGNKDNWWTEQSSEAFVDRAPCMINQYSEYTVRGKYNLNGRKTLNENIADNGGLKTSYDAYMSWLQKHDDPRANLPALNMTKQQLFFLSFAQVWCSYYTPERALWSLLTDVHSYPKYRVIGTLSNMPQFAKAFSCSVFSKMNPANKCTVW